MLGHLGEHELWARPAGVVRRRRLGRAADRGRRGAPPRLHRRRGARGGARRDRPALRGAAASAACPASVRPRRRRRDVFRKWADVARRRSPSAPAEHARAGWLRTDPHGWAGVLREHAARPMPARRALGHPRSTTCCADRAARSSSSTGAPRPAARRGSTRCSPGSSGSTSRGSTRRSRSPPRSPQAGDEAVTAFLAGFGAHLAVRSVVAVDVNLPTLNDFRIRESRRMLDAVARRTGR